MDTKQILFIVFSFEKEALLKLKGDKTWRELFLGALGIPCEVIPTGYPKGRPRQEGE